MLIDSQVGLKGGAKVDESTLRHVGSSCAGTALGNVLRTNQTLVKLDLSWNKLGVVSGIELGEALSVNAALTSFSVAYNSLGIQCVSYVLWVADCV